MKIINPTYPEVERMDRKYEPFPCKILRHAEEYCVDRRDWVAAEILCTLRSQLTRELVTR